MNKPRRILLIILLLVILIVSVFAFLALSGPVIGNTYSNIIVDLNGNNTSASGPSATPVMLDDPTMVIEVVETLPVVESTEEVIESTFTPTVTPTLMGMVITPIPFDPATFTPTATPNVLSALQTERALSTTDSSTAGEPTTTITRTRPPTFTPTAKAQLLLTAQAVQQTATALAELFQQSPTPPPTLNALSVMQTARAETLVPNSLNPTATYIPTLPNTGGGENPLSLTESAQLTLTASSFSPTPSPTLSGGIPVGISAVEQTATAQAELFNQTPTVDRDMLTDEGTDVPYSTPDPSAEVNFIGNGSAYVFYDDPIEVEQRVLVELQVFFDEIYITATPTSAITALPAPPQSRPMVDARATLTPRAARYSDDEIELPEKLMARLTCEGQFANCDDDRDGEILPLQVQEANSWRWSIVPQADVQGIQDLRLELWTVDENDQREQRIWTHDFQIGVGVDFLSQNRNLIIGVLVGIIGLMGGSFAVMRWRHYQESNRNRPRVFISYRRSVSAGYGRALHDALVNAGADVFIDIDDIHAGSFSQYIQDNIRQRKYFLVLLAPQTLESTWVRQEILYAREHERTIIPILINGFDLYGDEMPDNLTFLQEQNAVTLPLEHFDSGVKRIMTFIGLS